MLGAARVLFYGQVGSSATAGYLDRVLVKNPAWYLPLSETSGPTATAQAGPGGTYENGPQLGVTSIAQDDEDGKSVGLNGSNTYITCLSPLSGPDFTVDLIVQMDGISSDKAVLVTTATDGVTVGGFSLEINPDAQMRAWSSDGSAQVITGSVGDLQDSVAHKVTYQRQSGVSPSQRVLVDGVEVAADATVRTWSAVPTGTVYIGAWSSLIDLFDGLIAHIAGWNSYLPESLIDDLVRTQSVAWIEDHDFGSIQANSTREVSALTGQVHGRAPFVATAGDGVLVTTTESQASITIQAGATLGDNDTFTFSVTDANGSQSPTRIGTIDVVESTTFPFVTTSNPTTDHTGVASRPSYNASDPRSASVIDPMSGLEFFRVGGDFNTTVFLNGSTDSGLVFPHRLRTENTTRAQNVWNADGTLLMVNRYFSQTGDPANSAQSYLISVDGSHMGATGPWQIIRASSEGHLNEANPYWFWAPNNPLRAILIDDGAAAIKEWWPAGGDGHAVGEINTIIALPSGTYSNFGNTHRTHLQTTYDGRYYMCGCRRDSDAAWGGLKIDLIDQTVGAFAQSPFQSNDDNDRAALGISPDGTYTVFDTDRNGGFGTYEVVEIATNTQVWATTTNDEVSHWDTARIDGVEYLIGQDSDSTGFRQFRLSDGQVTQKANTPGNNPQHTSARNFKDLMETHGGVGGSSTGTRYAIWTRSGSADGHPPGILGIRLGTNDLDVLRYLVNHRTVRSHNSNEVHPHISPNAEYLAFPSNWHDPGVETDGDVHPYVCLIPSAWHNQNNDGS